MWRLEIVHAGVKAIYRPSPNRVTLLAPQRFAVPKRYDSILFHALTHATVATRAADRPVEQPCELALRLKVYSGYAI